MSDPVRRAVGDLLRRSSDLGYVDVDLVTDDEGLTRFTDESLELMFNAFIATLETSGTMLLSARELADALDAAGARNCRELAEAVQRHYQPKGQKPA